MTSISEAWQSIKDYTKEKTNPFLVTILVVWLIHHWELVYAFFTIDMKIPLEARIKYFHANWNSKPFVFDLLNVIWIAFAVLIATQVLIYSSKLIINLFNDIVSPLVAGAFKKARVIEKVKYDFVVNRNNELEKEIIVERETRMNALREKETAERNFQTGLRQAKDEAKKEVYQTLRLIDELGKDNLLSFFKDFSEHQEYQVSAFMEQLIRRGVVTDYEHSEVSRSYKLMVTAHGQKMRDILEVYKDFIPNLKVMVAPQVNNPSKTTEIL